LRSMFVPRVDAGEFSIDISPKVSPLGANKLVDVRVEVPSIMKDLSDMDVIVRSLELEIRKELNMTWLFSAI